jgi:hypothetical protein
MCAMLRSRMYIHLKRKWNFWNTYICLWCALHSGDFFCNRLTNLAATYSKRSNTTHTDSFLQKPTYGHTWNHARRLQPYIHGGGKGIGQLTVSTYVRRLSPYPKFRTSSIFDKTYIIEILYVTRIHHQLLIKFCYIIFKTNKYFFQNF